MNRSAKILALVISALMLLASTGCNKLRARDQLNKGVQAYKNARYEDAIEKFKNAVALDDSLINARLYLATAYANQYIPGADTPENNRNAEQAIQEFKNVLQKDPQNITSLKGIASLYFQMKKFEEAKEYNRKVIAADPNDPESYYSIAVINWTETYQPRMEERNKLGLKPEDPIKDKKVCEALKEKNEAKVQEGMDMLEKALKLREDYDDAMAYYNLLWREKADIECGDPAAREADLKKADEWVDQTLAAKKRKADKAAAAAGGGITMEQK
ncbi:MAG TPA: tetratricopeptide repeat protein [Terriglobales bacterium]|nr:tetratricopeptide repeat protein [Terriglobales bacterium]